MKKLIIAIVALLVLIGILVTVKRHQSTTANPTSAPLTQDDTKSLNDAWNTFSKYLAALKAHDLPALTSLSYQLSLTCKDPKQVKDCYDKMDAVYDIIKAFNQADFKHVVYDSKQVIIWTDWHTEKTDLAYGYARNVIYLVKKPDGTLQILSLTLPEEIIYTLIAKDDTDASLQKELAPRIVDTDGDMLVDEIENCSYPNAPKTCVKTDPTKKDTNGNGWWDSTESFFYAKTK